MDLSTEFEHTIDGMEWRDVLGTVPEMIDEILVDTPNPPPLPPFCAGQGFNTYPQGVERLSKRYPLGATPHSVEQPVMTALGCEGEQAAPVSYQEPLHNPTLMHSDQLDNQKVFHSKRECNVVPVVWLPEGMHQNLAPVGVLNCENQQDEDRPYIKKPLNAFMLFRKEHISNVMDEQESCHSAAANIILGQRWKGLSKEEQAKYYKEAEKERLLHAQRYPNWSSKDNYGIKKKKKRKAPTRPEATASKPKEVVHQTKNPCLIPAQTAAMKPSTSQTGVIEAPHTQAAVTESSTSMIVLVLKAHHTQREETEPSTSCTVTVELSHGGSSDCICLCHLSPATGE
ncbi:transcription factor 7-like 2 [Mastacembelus armatus]|uniref:Transcription factor 7-like 2 n=1 Tax=Mastacembelus armatus TaxID=205130 RepID=A0A7N8WLB9_9TELE|nr:transcription factor 7-like 2 [Mastacembelus armatus]